MHGLLNIPSGVLQAMINVIDAAADAIRAKAVDTIDCAAQRDAYAKATEMVFPALGHVGALDGGSLPARAEA